MRFTGDVSMVLEVLSNIVTAFSLGLLTPLTAACVLPLYPGFLAYLSSQSRRNGSGSPIALFGLAVTFGVILFMFLFGLVFSTILQVSLTNVIGIVSPAAFALLTVISLLLIFNIDIGKFIPKARMPVGNSPLRNASLFGFFFGAIVIPCNPLFIAALFAGSLSATGFAANMLSFVFFGVGMAFPLLAFSLVSNAKSEAVINFLIGKKRIINLVSGVMMLTISLYYLVFVFRLLG